MIRNSLTGIQLLVFVTIFAIGCEENGVQEAQAPMVEAQPSIPITEIPIDRNDPSPVSGRFEIVDFQISPVTAMDESDARAWLGQLVIVSAGALGAEGDICAGPRFEEHEEHFSEYFGVFESNRESLGLSSPEIGVISARCEGEPWHGVGSELIRVAGDTLLAVYDGVFLRLEPY